MRVVLKIKFIQSNYKPSFKASFDCDGTTRINLVRMTQQNPKDVLAIHLALKDIDNDDLLSIQEGFSCNSTAYHFKNESNGKTNTVIQKDLASFLKILCNKNKDTNGYLPNIFTRPAKLEPEQYLEKATNLINGLKNANHLDLVYPILSSASLNHDSYQTCYLV